MTKTLLLFVYGYFMVFGSAAFPEVKISQGILKGTYGTSLKGRTFNSFIGIPYAEPPIGDLRFKPPIPAKPWKGTLDATKSASICPQMNSLFRDFNVVGNEDCLYLNVYTPQLPDELNEGLLPVMFYIHGGGWICGSGNPEFHGPNILLDRDIVLVTINYRLGALGFLSTEDSVVSGNNALKDQSLALKWVKQNIKHFGGDPNKITVFGQSAGGASTHYQYLSPLNKGLIHGAIAQSGCATTFWASAPKGQAKQAAKKLAEFLNCPIGSSEEMVNCLKQVHAVDIINQDLKFMEWDVDPLIPFRPVVEQHVEGAFITETPLEIIRSGEAPNAPLMMGVTTDEGTLKSAGILHNPKLTEELNKDFNRIAPLLFGYDKSNPQADYIAEKIRKHYFGDKDIDISTMHNLTNMFSDSYFVSGINLAVNLHAKYSKQPVYYYLFGYRGSKTWAPFFGDPHHEYGVSHSDDLIYLFNMEGLFGKLEPNESEQKIIDLLTTLWSNFAMDGNPTPNSLHYNKWEPVQREHIKYYFIKNEVDVSMQKGLFEEERGKIWLNLPTNHPITRFKDEL